MNPVNGSVPNINNQGDLQSKLINARNFIKYILNMIGEIQDNYAEEH
jgi:hypothetical protein